MNLRVCVVFISLFCFGCLNSPSSAPPVIQGVTSDQLIPMLETIAQNGELKEILTSLTVGLENEGYMDEAVLVQELQSQPPEKIKRTVKNLIKTIQKKQTAMK